MDDIEGLWDSFTLNEKEGVPFDFGVDEDSKQSYLAARFMTSRVINIEAVVRTFRPLWRTVQGFTARDLGNNMMVFVFEDASDMERVLQAEPWMYDKCVRKYFLYRPIENVGFIEPTIEVRA